MKSMDSCEYIWEAGVGFSQSPPLNYMHDLNRWKIISFTESFLKDFLCCHVFHQRVQILSALCKKYIHNI